MFRALSTYAFPAHVAGFAFAVLGAPATAQETRIDPARVADYAAGLFCAPEDSGRRDAPGTIAGWIHVPDAPVVLEQAGRHVPAELGQGFGITYDLATNQSVALTHIVTHPPMPPGGQTYQAWSATLAPGETGTVFFQFDTEDELQPGTWTLSVFQGPDEILAVEFIVRAPSDLPRLAGACRDGLLLSLSPESRAATG